MTFKNISLVHVSLMRGDDKLPVGRLATQDRKIFFEYTPEFINTGLELSPFKLPLKPGIVTSNDGVFSGLFGVFNDSLPDGWGRLLLDRMLMKSGLNISSISPLDRLCYVGNHGMGALMYEPEIESSWSKTHNNDLDEIAEKTLKFQENDDDEFIDDLLSLNGSSAGVRPKILIKLKEKDWIIKFRSLFDPKDIGPIEYAYHLMAKAAQLDVPEAKLFSSKKNPGYFGVKRFDRIKNKHLHMHTISGLLHADHRKPSLDYEMIMKTTLWLTQDSRECEKQFRVAVFNVFSHNRDDHSKNFSFLMNEAGSWYISPAYDLTFSSGPNGEHSSMIMGEGKNPTTIDLLKLAEICGINKQQALQIINEIKSVISKWEVFAKDANVTISSQKMIKTTLDQLIKN